MRMQIRQLTEDKAKLDAELDAALRQAQEVHPNSAGAMLCGVLHAWEMAASLQPCLPSLKRP